MDLVYADENYATLYYCYQNTPASSLSNKPGTTGGEEYWVPTEVKDFVATKIFFSNLGFVENLGVNNLLLSDHGYIFGGLLPANTHYDAENPQTTNGNTILWVGSSVPSEAPFQVDASGNGIFTGRINASSGSFKGVVEAESGTMGPYTISQDGIHYIDPSSSGYWIDIFKDYLALNKVDSRGQASFSVSTNRGSLAPLLQLSETGRGVPALAIANGFVTGFGLGIRHGGSSNMTLDSTDNVVIFNNSSARTITLSPYDGLDGHIVAIIHTTSATLTVSSSKPIVQILSNGTTEAYTSASGRPEVLLAIYSASTQKWYLSFLKSS